MWTNQARRFATRVLPPGKSLPDRQPAYVRSWVYVFGVGSLAAFGVACVSGFALALGGPDWWRYNPVGHFFNSLHLWSVELFMALLVIHLWGKFWMAAWRQARPDLDHRRGRVRGLRRGVLHRVPLAAELRLAVDLHQQRQGRLQRGRDRRDLERDELRRDADVAHRAGAHRADRHHRRAHPAGPRPRRLPPTARHRQAPRPGQLPAAPPGPWPARTRRRGAAPHAATTSSRKAPSPG